MKDKKTNNNKLFTILTSLIAVMFVLSMFSGVVAAETPRENYQNTREQYQQHKEQYENARDKFSDAEDRFKQARQNYRDNKDAHSAQELKGRTSEFLERAIDQMIAHLEVMKNRVENSKNDLIPFDASANIDNHIAQLEIIRTDVQQAETRQEFVDAADSLRDQWKKIKLETQYYAGIIVNSKIDGFLSKADNVSTRMDGVIENLDAKGEDTSGLEVYTMNFKELVDKAKENSENIADLYTNHEGFGSDGMANDDVAAKEFLREGHLLQKDSHKILKDAATELRQFFREAKKLNGGNVVVTGTGTLEASGTGKATIEGDITVRLSARNGILVVSNEGTVTTNGTGTKEELGNGDVKYQGFGSATIEGSDVTVEISGEDIKLTATGTGSATLSGNGTYNTENDFSVTSEWDEEE